MTPLFPKIYGRLRFHSSHQPRQCAARGSGRSVGRSVNRLVGRSVPQPCFLPALSYVKGALGYTEWIPSSGTVPGAVCCPDHTLRIFCRHVSTRRRRFRWHSRKSHLDTPALLLHCSSARNAWEKKRWRTGRPTDRLAPRTLRHAAAEWLLR
jgi:hypothetical protein